MSTLASSRPASLTRAAPAPTRAAGVRLAAAASAAVGFVLIYLVAVGTPVGQRLDEAAMQWTAAVVTQDGWAETVLHAVSAGSVLLVGAALAVVTALIRGPRVAALGLLSAAAVMVGAQVLKLALTRPDFSVGALANSFPSGHVAAVTGLAVALLLAVPAGQWRRLALVVVAPVVVLTGWATLVQEWHRPSDVLGSVLLGAAVGLAAAHCESQRGRRRA
jgi:membrane-associated phospholipid phosphatase